MKSKNVVELMNWLEKRVRIIDLPMDYAYTRVIQLVEIAELEITNSPLLEQKIKEFKGIK